MTSNFFRRFYPIFHGLTPALPTFRLTFTSIRRHITTHTLSYNFSKNQIVKKNFLGPFPEPPGHPRTYILTSSNSSPRDTHLRIFSRLSTSSPTIAFTLALPTYTVTPTPTPPSDPAPRVTYHTFFPACLPPFTLFVKRWSLTAATPTLKSDPDPPHRLTRPTIYSRLSTSILTFS